MARISKAKNRMNRKEMILERLDHFQNLLEFYASQKRILEASISRFNEKKQEYIEKFKREEAEEKKKGEKNTNNGNPNRTPQA